MLAKPPANAFGFELDLSQGALTGVPAAMEGYFGQISTIGDITITSTPALLVQIGTTYIYDVEAIGPGGSLLTYSLDVFPSGMTINSATGLIGWSPVLADAGAHPVTVRVADSSSLFITQNFSITVTTSNTPPVANNDSIDVTSGAASVINVLANDTDADGTIDPASLVILSQPANGIALVNANGTVTYTPNAGFSGIDTFTYNVRDNQGALSNTAAVTITVAPAPETVTIDRAIFKAAGARWILRGADNPVIPGTTITARLNRTGETIGTSAVSTLGVWSVVVRNSPVIAVAGDTISAASSNGAILATFPVEVLG